MQFYRSMVEIKFEGFGIITYKTFLSGEGGLLSWDTNEDSLRTPSGICHLLSIACESFKENINMSPFMN